MLIFEPEPDSEDVPHLFPQLHVNMIFLLSVSAQLDEKGQVYDAGARFYWKACKIDISFLPQLTFCGTNDFSDEFLGLLHLIFRSITRS